MHLLIILMSGVGIQIAQLLLALTVLVFVHEMGHFLAARMFGIRVKKFYLFFDFLFPLPSVLNFALFKFTRGETEYGLGWFPLGGYVQIGGMVDESMDKEEMNAPPRPDDYRAKPVWQRFIVMIGGIVMNVIFGVLFYSIYLGGFQKDYIPAEEFNKYGIYAYPLAEEVGLKTGDKILAINGSMPERLDDVVSFRLLTGATVTIERDGQKLDVTLPGNLFKKVTSQQFIGMGREKLFAQSVTGGSLAEKYGMKDKDTIIAVDSIKVMNFGQFRTLLQGPYKEKFFNLYVNRGGKEVVLNVKTNEDGMLGFRPMITEDGSYKHVPYGFFKAIKYGFKDAFTTIAAQAIGFAKMFSGEVKVRDSVGGPIAMVDMFEKQWDWSHVFHMAAILSMVLAFMNFLPIPALDGGHMVMLIIEAIIRRPLSQKTQEIVQTIGVILLLGLMLFVFGNDILKKFGV